jgi:hypothetical protein
LINPGLTRGEGRWLAAGWLALLIGALLLAARYPHLPDAIPAYRTLLGTPLNALPRSPFSVLRIPAMGLGQLGATTVMAREASRARQRGWVTFWVAASMAAGAKTLVECGQYALLGTVAGSRIEAAFLIATLLPVAAFFVVAVRLWRAGSLRGAQPIAASMLPVLAASIVLWLLFAVLPRWMRSFE